MAADKNNVVEELTRPVIKLIVALTGLLVLRFIIIRLPGLGTEVPEVGITISALAGAIITVIMVAIIVNFGREIEPRLQRTLAGPEQLRADLAMIGKHLTFLLAIIVAYNGLDALLVPLLLPDPGPWAYDIVFLLVALIPTVVIAQRMFTNLDDITDLLTEQVKSATASEVQCTNCDETIRATLDFCPHCGSAVESGAGPGSNAAGSSVCPECEADVDPDAAFCGSCGSQLEASAPTAE